MSGDNKQSNYSIIIEEGKEDQTLQREIRLARNIQMKLLNGSDPEIDHTSLAGTSLPARLIGGDYYDFYKLSDNKIRVVIGDVMGKGIPAAMLMILTRGAFRSASENTQGPAETLTAMNNAIYRDLKQLKSFVTLFCCDWDVEHNTITYANAGHVLPMHIKEKGVESLETVSGIMLGGLPNQAYEEKSISIDHGETVFFYTDGIVEAQNGKGEFYQTERLRNLLQELYGNEVSEIEEAVSDSLFQFTQGEAQKDDITMVILQNDDPNSAIQGYNSPINT
ncbi:PP2C family protein-serine/threonine phosphatase [Alkalibacillus silvisoli]|uniref:PPM-type phosphatase domain-containing protein n=1 Tax=Alkalibacillus silvisoli TaxID=392823 RepID=A0ABN1A195_9BACI